MTGTPIAVLGTLAVVTAAVSACTSSGGSGRPGTTVPMSTYQFPTYSTRPAPTTPPASTGPNVHPGEKPPTLPAAAKHNTRGAALQFAQYWMQTLDWGYATTDSSLAKAAFSPSCTDCARFMKEFDDVRARGQHYRGGRLSFKESAIQPNDHHNGSTYVIDVTVRQAALQVVGSTGHVVDSGPAVSRDISRIWIKWTGRWSVVDWKEVVVK